VSLYQWELQGQAKGAALLSQIDLEPERVQMYFMSAAEGARFANVAKEMTETIRELGPSPLGRNKSE